MPKIFNVAVDRVVCHWISLTVEDKSTTHEGLGMEVGRCTGVFYADDSMIVSKDPEWIQGAINLLIGLFRRVNLVTNVVKSKTMTCQLGEICTGVS